MPNIALLPKIQQIIDRKSIIFYNFILTARISVGFGRNRFISGESMKSLPIHMLNVYFDFATFNAVALMNGIYGSAIDEIWHAIITFRGYSRSSKVK